MTPAEMVYTEFCLRRAQGFERVVILFEGGCYINGVMVRP